MCRSGRPCAARLAPQGSLPGCSLAGTAPPLSWTANHDGQLAPHAMRLTYLPAGEGLVLQPGAYKAPLVFTGIRSFKQFGLKVLVRGCWARALHLFCTLPVEGCLACVNLEAALPAARHRTPRLHCWHVVRPPSAGNPTSPQPTLDPRAMPGPPQPTTHSKHTRITPHPRMHSLACAMPTSRWRHCP